MKILLFEVETLHSMMQSVWDLQMEMDFFFISLQFVKFAWQTHKSVFFFFEKFKPKYFLANWRQIIPYRQIFAYRQKRIKKIVTNLQNTQNLWKMCVAFADIWFVMCDTKTPTKHEVFGAWHEQINFSLISCHHVEAFACGVCHSRLTYRLFFSRGIRFASSSMRRTVDQQSIFIIFYVPLLWWLYSIHRLMRSTLKTTVASNNQK